MVSSFGRPHLIINSSVWRLTASLKLKGWVDNKSWTYTHRVASRRLPVVWACAGPSHSPACWTGTVLADDAVTPAHWLWLATEFALNSGCHNPRGRGLQKSLQDFHLLLMQSQTRQILLPNYCCALLWRVMVHSVTCLLEWNEHEEQRSKRTYIIVIAWIMHQIIMNIMICSKETGTGN